jgi:putative ABC transport system substrate-binding protein
MYPGPDPISERSVRGLKEGLREAGMLEGRDVRFEVRDAQGDLSLLPAIARQYVAQGVDVIVPLGTPSLVAAARAVRGTGRPVVFSQVFNPYPSGANVAKSAADHPPNLTGVAAPPPVGGVLDLIRALVPSARRVGVIYNAGEPNGVYAVALARSAAAERGLTFVERTVSQSNEVQQAAQALAARSDVLACFCDHTVISALEALAGVASATHRPLFTAVPSAGRGSAVDLGPDFHEAARLAGRLVARVLRGESPAAMPIEENVATTLVVNLTAARRQGLAVPPSVVARAQEVVGR